ncbi:uncharacterized protein LOC132198306 [Neocloeon triangulifer]|uniref:uncharacterized protein LOC132198306 n=1 Tax=Neocloeon triangulifer TaxID=2078957 RepID=UPI00286F212C|nr:uncharacterized protein LOC132198306 [Neocloeon triangulifer]
MPRTNQPDLTESELKTLVTAIIQRKAHDKIKNLEFYKSLVNDFVLNGRSASLMKAAMYEQVAPNFEKYCNRYDANLFKQRFYKESVPVSSKVNRAKILEELDSSSDSEYELHLTHGRTKSNRALRPRNEKHQDKEDKDADAIQMRSPQSKRKMECHSEDNHLRRTKVSRTDESKIDGPKQSFLVPREKTKTISSHSSFDETATVVSESGSAVYDLLTGKQKAKVSEELLNCLGLIESPKATSRKQPVPDKLSMESSVVVEDIMKTKPQPSHSTDVNSPKTRKKHTQMIPSDSEDEDAEKQNTKNKAARNVKWNDNYDEFDSQNAPPESIGDLLIGKKHCKAVSLVENLFKGGKIAQSQNLTVATVAEQEKDSDEVSIFTTANIMTGKEHQVQEQVAADLLKIILDQPEKPPTPRLEEDGNETEEEFEAEELEMVVDTEKRVKDPKKQPPASEEKNESQNAEKNEERDKNASGSSKTVPRSAKEAEDKAPRLMVAVGQDIRGNKCYFRLVPMSVEEVMAIEGTCIPYQLH